MTRINKIWLTDKAVHILTADGREASELFADYPRLCNAPREALEDYYVHDSGIHWNTLNEDLSFDGFFKSKQEKPVLYRLFMSLPEINVSAVARRMGISQSLMAQYVSGTKTPSKERETAIINEIKALGNHLATISI